MVTPFIKPIPNSRGILYATQNGVNDMTMSYGQSNMKFRMSKFALINLPSLQVPNAIGDNAVQVNSAGDRLIYQNASVYGENMIRYFAESYENYCMNLEALLMSNPGYDPSIRRRVSERVFWKWVKELGAVRFRRANALELDGSVVSDDVRFVEEDEITGLGYAYGRVVKYVADIDIVNSVQSQNAYTEIYVYVPKSVGAMPYVLFNSISDSNYSMTDPGEENPDGTLKYAGIDPSLIPNVSYHNVTAATLDEPYLVGRHYDDVHPFQLDTHAYYDYTYDDNYVEWEISGFDPDVSGGVPAMAAGRWFYDPSLTAYSYYTDNRVEYGGISGGIGDARNRVVRRRKLPSGSDVYFFRSCLDGIVIDFDKTHYKAMNENPAIRTFSEFASINGVSDFSYNAVLLYYELYDPENPTDSITNLFGVQFLSMPIQAGTYWKLPSIDKMRPDAFHKVNGNSMSHVVNLKYDTSVEAATQERSVNDYSTFSLDLYVRALTAMRNMTDAYADNLVYITNLSNDVAAQRALLVNSSTRRELESRIANLESAMVANSALFDNTNNVMGMIRQLYQMYDNILSNGTQIRVNYTFDKMELNSMIVLDQQYNWKTSQEENIGSIIGIGTPKILRLSKNTNYFRHYYTTGAPPSPTDIFLSAYADVYINDTDVSWENGQVFDISFSTRIDVGSFGIRVYTDANDTLNTGAVYSASVITLDASYFNSTNDYMPIVRIICVNKATLEFVVDKIR